MARAKIKVPAGRKIQCSRQRPSGGKKSAGPEQFAMKQDTENCPPNLDFNVIEQIANGVEKMILSWGHPEEVEGENDTALEVESMAPEKEASTMWTLPARKEVLRSDSKLKRQNSDLSFHKESDDGCDFLYPIQIQEHPGGGAVTADIPGGITAEVSLDGDCPGESMGRAISKIVTEAVKHSGTMMMGNTRTEKTVTKTATYWYLEASNGVSNDSMSVCTEEETSGLKSANARNKDVDSSLQKSPPKQSLEAITSAHKDVPTSGQSSNTHSSPPTPPIRERSGKRVQSDPDGSKKKLQLSVSKKTKWSEMVHPLLPPPPPAQSPPPAPVECKSANYSEDDDSTRSPRSDCTVLESRSECSWYDPLDSNYPCQELPTHQMKGSLAEGFGPWDNGPGDESVHQARIPQVEDTKDPDTENESKEKKSSFVSFKLWKASKQKSNGGEPSPSKTHITALDQEITDNHNEMKSRVAETTPVAPPPADTGDNGMQRSSTREVEDLQIALLECATEYEIKTIEMKMKLKDLKKSKCESLLLDTKSKASEMSDETTAQNKSTTLAPTCQPGGRETQRLEVVKKQVYKLQRQKGCLTKELTELKQKERQFELQKKSLDAALLRVNRLQRELVRKEQEVEDWQLRHKHAEAQLQEAEITWQRAGTPCELAGLPMDTSRLLTLLPTLHNLINTIGQKDTGGGYYIDGGHMMQHEHLCDPDQIDAVVSSLAHEIQGLQHELNKMACPNWKQRQLGHEVEQGVEFRPNTRGEHCGHSMPASRPSSRLSKGRYQYGKF